MATIDHQSQGLVLSPRPRLRGLLMAVAAVVTAFAVGTTVGNVILDDTDAPQRSNVAVADNPAAVADPFSPELARVFGRRTAEQSVIPEVFSPELARAIGQRPDALTPAQQAAADRLTGLAELYGAYEAAGQPDEAMSELSLRTKVDTGFRFAGESGPTLEEFEAQTLTAEPVTERPFGMQ